MKLMSRHLAKFTAKDEKQQPVVCRHLSTPTGIQPCDEFLSCDRTCQWCGGKDHYLPIIDPAVSGEKTWLCQNRNCEVYNCKTGVKAIPTHTTKFCGIVWPEFCEINGIGDVHHGVKFEHIQQDKTKLSYLFGFCSSPRGIVLMRGTPGTGKTYAAMGACELFTRKSQSCLFTTQKQMSDNWLETFNKERFNNYIGRITNVSLLVVDDFGTMEPSPPFLTFFMELINTRLQWTNRGTIITTNLAAEKLATYCGDNLSDRLKTGQLMQFTGSTRRKKTER